MRENNNKCAIEHTNDGISDHIAYYDLYWKLTLDNGIIGLEARYKWEGYTCLTK
jgi:hypothetical protein